MNRFASGLCAFAAACAPVVSGPEVVGVYPSAHAFSQPMREGDFLDHLRLERTDTGEDLTGVFFDNIHELWSADRTRITLLVDPGRVKRGLKAHDRLGRAFEAGGSYRLHIDDTWTNTHHVPLAAPYGHDFVAAPEDRRQVEPEQWCMTLPAAGSTAPLHLDFGEPVDHVSVHRLLRVLSPDGTPLRGGWALGPEERTATWTPASSWAAPIEAHVLRVSGRFEDIAGNNLNARFEHIPGAVLHNEGTPVSLGFDHRCDHPITTDLDEGPAHGRG